MEASVKEAINALDSIYNRIKIESGGIDNGKFREILLDYAKNTTDMYTPVQDDDAYERGKPVLYSPTLEEWANFKTLLEKLHQMDIHRVGVALITLPPGTPGLGLPRQTTKYSLNGKKYMIQTHKNNSNYFKATLQQDGAFYLPSDKKKQEPYYHVEVDISLDHDHDHQDSDFEKWLDTFEQQCRSTFTTPVYAAEKDVDTEEHRENYQLFSESCIYPLEGNRLDSTSSKIGGVHTPWTYVSPGPGTMFAAHNEDAKATAINVLHAGHSKIFTTVASHHAKKFENVIARDLQIEKKDQICDNWIRELHIYIPRETLDKNGIHYCLFEQSVNQVVIAFSGTYHQGVNRGANVAEAVNYGDKYWMSSNAKLCAEMNCRHTGSMRRTNLEERETGEPQVSVGIRDFSTAESIPETAQGTLRTTPKDNQAKFHSGTAFNKAALKEQTLEEQRKSKRLLAQQDVSFPNLLQHAQPEGGDPKRVRVALRSPAGSNGPAGEMTGETDELLCSNPVKTATGRAEAELLGHPVQAEEFQEQSKQGLNKWEKWEANNQSSYFKPTVLFQKLQGREITTGGPALKPPEVAIVTAVVTAFGSVEAFIQLKNVLPSLRNRSCTTVPSTSKLSNLTKLLDQCDTISHCLSIRERYLLATFACLVNTGLKAERPARDIKMKTHVYESIMAEVYPDLRKTTGKHPRSQEWDRRYRDLEKRYSSGKRWLALANATSWLSLSLLPTADLSTDLSIRNSSVHKLNNEAFGCLEKCLVTYKRDFLCKVSKRLEQIMSIDLDDGSLRVAEQQILLEITTWDEIKSLPELSESLSKLACKIK